ncbi:hypothetical protein ILUMI_06823 [Ignelater luminosus]|uniref:Copia protein n=1 Tax=Ignelater luminosus TaxID=2038154 RepID=A0A8K0GEZ5_IGNLU|nr:hypothetical protein ILUMI_06823 [Ignelater luminosus]
MTEKPYRQLIGCLTYLMINTRPDICFALNYFNKFQNNATDEIWKYLTRILRYIKGTVNYALTFKADDNQGLEAYSDSDWANEEDRKSISGYMYKWNGQTILWSTKKQHCISLSTAEAELKSVCTCIQDGLWLKKIFKDLQMNIDKIVLYEDNQACISIIKIPDNIRRTKHIDIKYRFVCDKVKSGEIEVKYIDSKGQLADIFTKGLSKVIFRNFVATLNLENFSEGER